jgi:hypothetical protein
VQLHLHEVALSSAILKAEVQDMSLQVAFTEVIGSCAEDQLPKNGL